MRVRKSAIRRDTKETRIQASLNALKKAHGLDFILPYSAKSGLGQVELWKLLRDAGSAASSGDPGKPCTGCRYCTTRACTG